MDRLKGKVAFITGAAVGIGRASSILFGNEGAKVAVADIDQSGGNETVRMINGSGNKAVYIKTDVTNPQSVKDAIHETIDQFGKLDIIYNNVGGSRQEDCEITKLSIEVWEKTLSLNLFSTFLCCKYGIPELVKIGGGSVILTGSNVAIRGWQRSAYTAAKGAIVSLTRVMAVDYAKYNIRVNCICPGATLTERLLKAMQLHHFDETQRPLHLLGYCEPSDIGYAALYLASDESKIVTGAIFSVDSGYTAVGRINETDLLEKKGNMLKDS